MSRYKNEGQRCLVPGCGRDARTRGWCRMHYRRWLKNGHPGEPTPRIVHQKRDPVCTEPDCDRPHDARGYCKRCYKRYWRGGTQ